jgi:hypothetical protein
MKTSQVWWSGEEKNSVAENGDPDDDSAIETVEKWSYGGDYSLRVAAAPVGSGSSSLHAAAGVYSAGHQLGNLEACPYALFAGEKFLMKRETIL